MALISPAGCGRVSVTEVRGFSVTMAPPPGLQRRRWPSRQSVMRHPIEEGPAATVPERGDPELPVAAELSGEIEVGVDGAVEGWDCGPFGIEETP
jgi:hypothetical protein